MNSEQSMISITMIRDRPVYLLGARTGQGVFLQESRSFPRGPSDFKAGIQKSFLFIVAIRYYVANGLMLNRHSGRIRGAKLE